MEPPNGPKVSPDVQCDEIKICANRRLGKNARYILISIWTNNLIERLFAEVKKRSHEMAVPFRNETICPLLFNAQEPSLILPKI